MAQPQRWQKLVGGIGRPVPLVVTPGSASARGRRKQKPGPPRDNRERPTPLFSFDLRACNWWSLWNCLRLGPWYEFSLHRLMRFYGFT